MAYRIDIEGGKYTFINDNGVVEVLRYGEKWQNETGNKALLCLLQKVEEYEKHLKLIHKDTFYESENDLVSPIHIIRKRAEKALNS